MVPSSPPEANIFAESGENLQDRTQLVWPSILIVQKVECSCAQERMYYYYATSKKEEQSHL